MDGTATLVADTLLVVSLKRSESGKPPATKVAVPPTTKPARGAAILAVALGTVAVMWFCGRHSERIQKGERKRFFQKYCERKSRSAWQCHRL
jgi:hypothetical protein